jgi:hypothetical protein
MSSLSTTHFGSSSAPPESIANEDESGEASPRILRDVHAGGVPSDAEFRGENGRARRLKPSLP